MLKSVPSTGTDMQASVKDPKKTQSLYEKKTNADELSDERQFHVATKNTVSDVVRVLNYDHELFNGLKPLILDERSKEIENAHRNLVHIQREHDNLCVANSFLEKEILKLKDVVNTLDKIGNDAEYTNQVSYESQQAVLKEIEDIGYQLEREKKLTFMYEHMRVRTRDDIVDIRANNTNYSNAIKKYKSEMITLQSNLRAITHDVGNYDKEFEAMIREIEVRKDQRQDQIQSLLKFAEESETSTIRFQNELANEELNIQNILTPKPPPRSFATTVGTFQSAGNNSTKSYLNNTRSSIRKLRYYESDDTSSSRKERENNNDSGGCLIENGDMDDDRENKKLTPKSPLNGTKSKTSSFRNTVNIKKTSWKSNTRKDSTNTDRKERSSNNTSMNNKNNNEEEEEEEVDNMKQLTHLNDTLTELLLQENEQNTVLTNTLHRLNLQLHESKRHNHQQLLHCIQRENELHNLSHKYDMKLQYQDILKEHIEAIQQAIPRFWTKLSHQTYRKITHTEELVERIEDIEHYILNVLEEINMIIADQSSITIISPIQSSSQSAIISSTQLHVHVPPHSDIHVPISVKTIQNNNNNNSINNIEDSQSINQTHDDNNTILTDNNMSNIDDTVNNAVDGDPIILSDNIVKDSENEKKESIDNSIKRDIYEKDTTSDNKSIIRTLQNEINTDNANSDNNSNDNNNSSNQLKITVTGNIKELEKDNSSTNDSNDNNNDNDEEEEQTSSSSVDAADAAGGINITTDRKNININTKDKIGDKNVENKSSESSASNESIGIKNESNNVTTTIQGTSSRSEEFVSTHTGSRNDSDVHVKSVLKESSSSSLNNEIIISSPAPTTNTTTNTNIDPNTSITTTTTTTALNASSMALIISTTGASSSSKTPIKFQDLLESPRFEKLQHLKYFSTMAGQIDMSQQNVRVSSSTKTPMIEKLVMNATSSTLQKKMVPRRTSNLVSSSHNNNNNGNGSSTSLGNTQHKKQSLSSYYKHQKKNDKNNNNDNDDDDDNTGYDNVKEDFESDISGSVHNIHTRHNSNHHNYTHGNTGIHHGISGDDYDSEDDDDAAYGNHHHNTSNIEDHLHPHRKPISAVATLSLDRNTIKRISQLVVKRNTIKSKKSPKKKKKIPLYKQQMIKVRHDSDDDYDEDGDINMNGEE